MAGQDPRIAGSKATLVPVLRDKGAEVSRRGIGSLLWSSGGEAASVRSVESAPYGRHRSQCGAATSTELWTSAEL
ncbi:hypothetical protein NDU88_002404 [Pleurodeles waltl]|uniref:Uncharacterized protein n=1 Tax=Pleurodeles waltl TaxID=8319 RepID=A0AAV7VDM0_PLEWA|nr:hypothetical protein NDU88_002404 [Pleurodeles waltl]